MTTTTSPTGFKSVPKTIHRSTGGVLKRSRGRLMAVSVSVSRTRRDPTRPAGVHDTVGLGVGADERSCRKIKEK